MPTNQLTQVHFLAGSQGHENVAASDDNSGTYAQDEADYHSALLKLCPENLWHQGSYASGCPRPILVGQHHQEQMEHLHEALALAIADIVQRWWTDPDARFPERMPLEKEEEELLKVGHDAVKLPLN